MAKKNKPSKNKRSNRKILDAFQIAERAENRSGDDSDDYDGDDLHEVRDGIMDASRLLKGTGDEDGDEDDFDDEEIDSDEALGSDDDYDVLNSKFSQTIRDKAKRDKRRQKGEDIESSDEEEGYASVDESKFVSLSEAWDMDDKDLQKYEKKSSANEVVLDDNWNTESSESESESDEESENDDESDVFEQFDDEDDVDLTKTISGLKSSLKKPEKIKKRLVTETTEENEFGVPGGSGGLSINDMMAAVDSSVAKDAILIDQDEEKSKVLPTPLPKRIQQRHDRKVAYEITKEEVSKWEDTVQQNRRAEVLKFPLNPTVTHNDSTTTFKSDNVPSTELEQKIHNVLEQSSLLDDKKEKTFEEIAVAKMSAEEMKKRTNELRLMRELMFRDEKRAKRIKKIKSKQYRKIQKKERLKNQEMVEGSDAESDVEDHDLKRAKERMTLKHKTQGQWAKSMIKSGLSKDASNRAELEEMLRQGEKLRTKQLGYEDGDQSDDAISDIENEYDRDDEEADNQLKNNLGKGVLAMDFMKNADEKRKQENAKELELLRKLEAGEDLDQFNDSESAVNITKNQGRRVYTPNAAVANGEIQKVNDEIMKEVQDDESSNLYNKMSKKFVDTKAKAVEDKVTKEPVTSTSNSDAEGDEESNPWLTASKEPTQKSNKIAVVDKESSKLSKAAAKIAKSRKRKSGQAVEESLIDVEETLKVTLDDDTEGNTFVQKDLIKEAFAGDDVVTEFEIEKKQVAREEDDKEEDLTLPGWGDWAGGNKKSKKRKVVRKIDGVVQKDKRKDKNLKNVIINEKVNKKNLKYQSSAVPFPFESREQYERSLRMPVGQEWTSRETHQKLTMPRVITKQGTVIDPLKAPFK